MKRAASELKTVFRTSVIPFGIHTVVTTDTENALLAGRPDAALEAARQEVPAGHRVPNQLRHRLDVAMAHAELGQSDEARTVLSTVAKEAPQWLTQQQQATRVVDRLAENFRRALPPDLVQLYQLVPAL
ncbi:MAG: tetratricopeptide repeat protein [Myxococcota bacterium]